MSRMNEKQLKHNITYLGECMKGVIDQIDRGDGGPGKSTLSNWVDILEGRKHCPGPGQVWSDVEQPKC